MLMPLLRRSPRRGRNSLAPHVSAGQTGIQTLSPVRDGTSHVAHICCQFRALCLLH